MTDTKKFLHGLTVLPLIAAVAFLAACSSGSTSPGVAAIGGPSGSASASPTLNAYQATLAYAQCIRSHGVPGFPDPQQSGGGLSISSTAGFDPDSPAFQTAMTDCEALSPAHDGGASRPPFDPTKIAAWTTCLRAHDMPKLPDPQNMGNGVSIDINGTGISQTTAQAAMAACSSLSPGGETGLIAGGSQ